MNVGERHASGAHHALSTFITSPKNTRIIVHLISSTDMSSRDVVTRSAHSGAFPTRFSPKLSPYPNYAPPRFASSRVRPSARAPDPIW